jgi:hypothetical protein
VQPHGTVQDLRRGDDKHGDERNHQLFDSGGFGSLTITRSITIDCRETLASILVGDTPDIIINLPVGDPKDPLRTVRLRNIVIAGAGQGSQGISILSAAAVILEDLSIAGLSKQGISDTRTEGGTVLVVKGTTIANNGGAGVAAAASPSGIVLDNVHSDKNVAVAKGNNVTVNRSVFSGNAIAGIEADSGAQLTVDNSVVSHNTTGVTTGGGTIALSNSDIVFNSTGITGATTSFGNNRIFGNSVAGMAPTAAGAAAPALGQQ